MIDTLAIVKILKKAGFSEKQAEAQAEVISYTIDSSINNQTIIETKLLETEKKLEEKIVIIEHKFLEMEKRILQAMGRYFITILAILIILIFFLEFKLK